MSNSLWPHGLQHTRFPYPSLFHTVRSNSCPLNWWYHATISSSVTPFSSCPQSFPESGSFPMSRLFISWWPKYWSFTFSISPSNEYSGFISFRIDWFDLLTIQWTLKSLLQYPLLFTKSRQFYLNIKIAYYTILEPIFMQSHSLSFIFSIL